MKCIVIDDEPLAREGMKLLIKEVPELELLGTFSNIVEANQFVRLHPVDLIFLDIQMPLMTGLDYLKSQSERPMVIITTAYPEYALEGFEFDVVDYLTKPIRFERFYKAVNKALKLYANTLVQTQLNIPINSDNEYLFVRSNRKYIRVSLEQIKYIEGLKDYVIIHYKKENIPLSINLKAVVNKLPSESFIRVSKSFIVNKKYIEFIDNDLINLGDVEISIGDKYKEQVYKMILDGNVLKRDY